MAQKAFKRCKIVIVWNQAPFRKKSQKIETKKKYIENPNKINLLENLSQKPKK